MDQSSGGPLWTVTGPILLSMCSSCPCSVSFLSASWVCLQSGCHRTADLHCKLHSKQIALKDIREWDGDSPLAGPGRLSRCFIQGQGNHWITVMSDECLMNVVLYITPWRHLTPCPDWKAEYKRRVEQCFKTGWAFTQISDTVRPCDLLNAIHYYFYFIQPIQTSRINSCRFHSFKLICIQVVLTSRFVILDSTHKPQQVQLLARGSADTVWIDIIDTYIRY